MLMLFTGLTGCEREETEFLEKELVQEESGEKSGTDTDQKDAADKSAASEKNQSEPEKNDPGTPAAETHRKSASDRSDAQEEADTEAADVSQTIYVDICGAVASPGVYELPSGSRVFQAIEKAGGYLPEAAASYLNRAKGLSDGQQIYVPTQAEVDSQRIAATEDGVETASGSNTDNGTGQGAAGEDAGTTGNGTASGADGKINLNTADVSQLTTLTGVGESKALAIIAYREENGPFTSTEDIMNVPGIKEGTYEKIKDKIAIE